MQNLELSFLIKTSCIGSFFEELKFGFCNDHSFQLYKRTHWYSI